MNIIILFKSIILLSILSLFQFAYALTSSSKTYHVSSSAELDRALLSASVDNVNSKILITENGLYTSFSGFTYNSISGKNLLISSIESKKEVSISGELKHRALSLNDNRALFKIDNLTIKDGSNKGIGAGIYVKGRSVYIKNVHFINNRALIGGALSGKVKHCEITSSEFDSNFADSFGGAVWLDKKCASSNIEKSNFTNNETFGDGGAVAFFGKKLFISGSEFIENRAKEKGGAVYTNVVETRSCKYIKNVSNKNGGAIYGIDIDSKNIIYEDNFAKNNGGAVFCSGTIKDNLSVYEKNSCGLPTGSSLASSSKTPGSINVKNSFFSGLLIDEVEGNSLLLVRKNK